MHKILLVILTSISVALYASPYNPPDSTIVGSEIVNTILQKTDSIPAYDTINSFEDFLAQNEGAFVLDMLDSLVNQRFYNTLNFVEDTTILNTYNFPAGFVPEYPDSVIEARIAELNKESVIDLAYNKQVKNFIIMYSTQRRDLAAKVLGLAELYFPLFEEQLDRYNMPLELKYLAIVESALNPKANSRAGAKGLWQFMYGTGKMYGLKSNSLVEDRFDPYKSTIAACEHLQDLYDIYGNWSLAMAAYNSGPGNVNKAIRRAGGVKSYWAVWPFLPRETRGYVPAFIGVMYLLNHAAEHNIYPQRPQFMYAEVDTVTVNDVLSFDQISELLGVPLVDLEFLNPAYKNGIIPTTKKQQYILRLPREYVGDFIDKEKELYAYKSSKGIEKDKLLAEIKKAQERSIHVVRSGENLGSIAQKYRTSVSRLKSWNNLRGSTIYPGQKLVVYAPGYVPSNNKSTATAVNTKDRDEKYHTVKSGENLGLIANKYKCSVSDLKKWNNLKGNTIKPKQKLLVYASKPKEDKPKPQKSTTSENGYVYHTVRSGDTLWDIAKLYDGVSVEQIKKLNNIKNSKRLKPGQKLKVSAKS
jgi:membrane-bound lytic murein transglycosylase D